MKENQITGTEDGSINDTKNILAATQLETKEKERVLSVARL